MKWKNLKTNPPKNNSRILIRVKDKNSDAVDCISIWQYFSGGIKYTVNDIEYEDSVYSLESGTWLFRKNTDHDIYYLEVYNLKQIEIDDN